MNLASIAQAVLPSLAVSIIMLVINNHQKKREKARDARNLEREQYQDKLIETRKQETILHLNLQMATAKLAYANAMAIKRGRPNGEIEEGIAAYETAKSEYLNFLNKQAMESLTNTY